ncbi:MAG: shikimate kinase [Bacteroidales bacterium]|nr:shikimate kinase [Bacteroidales bacterium]
MIIALTGFMGCGKTTIGRLLHTALPGCELIDLDKYITEKTGRAIPEIFSDDGEAVFRKIEADCLEEIISRGGDVILSLGGGAVMTPRCFELVKSSTRCFYLKASPATLRAHLIGNRSLEEAAKSRPMLLGNGIEDLLAKREPVYEAVADSIIETDGRSARDVANEIFYIV